MTACTESSTVTSPQIESTKQPTPQISLVMHEDAVSAHHRFSPVSFRGAVWDLSHLDAFALKVEIADGLSVDVVILFECHCFSTDIEKDPRGASSVPPDELYRNSRETRVLNEERYLLSQLVLRQVIQSLPDRPIRIARDNYVTLEIVGIDGKKMNYAVFFAVEKDGKRRKRLLLRVQSAYPLAAVSHRIANGQKVRFAQLIKKTYLGQPLRG